MATKTPTKTKASTPKKPAKKTPVAKAKKTTVSHTRTPKKTRALIGKTGAASTARKKKPVKRDANHRARSAVKYRTDYKCPSLRDTLYETLVACSGNVTKTCKLMNLNMRSLYYALEHDTEFNSEFERAMNLSLKTAEDELKRRAVDGVDKPVWFKGECVGHERQYSDGLLSKLLAAHDRKWRTNNLEVTGADGGPIQASISIELPDNGRGDRDTKGDGAEQGGDGNE